jgi:O-methyltransferase
MKLLKFRGLFKGFFFKFKLHKIMLSPGILIFLGNLSKLSSFINSHKSIAYNDFYTRKRNYDKRKDLFKYIIEKESLQGKINYIEFGVANGDSFKWWVNNNNDPSSVFAGFDTFSGLPENWGPFKKGDMSTDNKIPEIDDHRCQFYEGLFQQTLPAFVRNFDFSDRSIIHMDADLFSSTLYVLTTLAPYLKKNDIIFFDEFNVPMHEFFAFDIFVNSYYLKYEIIGAINNFYQVAVKIA